MPDLAIRFDVVAIGLMTGLGYALLASGLVLVYRATRIVNFAHGQIGTFAAFMLVYGSHEFGLPYPLAIVGAVAVGALIGVIVERALIRPLEGRSRVSVLVATVGVVQILLVLQGVLPRILNARYPVAVQWSTEINGLVLHGEHFTLLLFGPLVLIALGLFLSRSRYGLAIRAIADNRAAAQLAGISAERTSTMVWALAGLLAAVAAILTSPLSGGGGVSAGLSLSLGPGLLLRALAAGLIGRMTDIRWSVVGGLGIGVIEAVLFASYPADLGLVDLVLFVLILGLLLVRSREGSESDDDASFGDDPVPLPEQVRNHPRVRRIRTVAAIAGVAIVLVAPFVYSSSTDLFLLARIPIYAMIGISIVILTGWAGQLSLGQMAFVGLGAVGTAALGSRGVPFGAAIGYMTIAGAILSALIGAPALRLRGLFLTVTTLGLAVAASSYLLQLDLFQSGEFDVSVIAPGSLGPIDFDSFRVNYYACVIALVVTIAMARRIRSGGIGRLMIAVEGNENSARAMTTSPAVTKLIAFTVSGALATFAGAMLGGVSRSFEVDLFSPEQSLQVLAMVVVGGIGSVAGAVIGAFYILGLPQLLGDSATVQLATSGIGLVVVLRFFPGGLVELIGAPVRRVLAKVAGMDAASNGEAAAEKAGGDGSGLAQTQVVARTVDEIQSDHTLEVSRLHVALGGRTIIDDVDLEIRPGEIVGLIGSNGAGKTTFMNAVGGFLPSTGQVTLDGEELSALSPSERARRGLGRSFQSALLYPRLSIRECVQVALEAHRRTEVIPSLLAFPPAVRDERWSRSEADAIIGLFNLGDRADQPAGELSTGTRRIVELACLVALRPSVVLLDEPMAGIAQRESEAMAPLLLQVRRELGASMLVIEHDLPMITSISDRMYCFDQGSVLAEGTPQEVQSDPLVIASYLGTDVRAIERSGSTGASL